MTDIYVDVSITGMPDAADYLRHLLEAGHRLIAVGATPEQVLADLPGVSSADALPERAAGGSWHVSADPAICAERRADLQTLLVGPRLAPSHKPGPRCDAETRDLSTAVLEILGREVMG